MRQGFITLAPLANALRSGRILWPRFAGGGRGAPTGASLRPSHPRSEAGPMAAERARRATSSSGSRPARGCSAAGGRG